MPMRSRVTVCLALTASVVVAQTDPVHLSFCDSSNANQLFYYDPAHAYIVLASSGFCLDVFYYGVSRSMIALWSGGYTNTETTAITYFADHTRKHCASCPLSRVRHRPYPSKPKLQRASVVSFIRDTYPLAPQWARRGLGWTATGRRTSNT